MKKIGIATLLILVTQLGFAVTLEEESRFLSVVRDAYSKKDKEAIMALYCWDKVDPRSKQFFPIFHSYSEEVLSVVYVTNFVYRPDCQTNNGVGFIPNITPIKKIQINFKVEPPMHKWLIEYAGEKDGKLMLVQRISNP